MNLLPFSISLLRAHWKLIVAALVGMALCYPVASCSGRRSAFNAQSAKIIAASAKVTVAAAKAEQAAILADMARSANTAKEADELREVIDNVKSEAVAGPAVSVVLRELRQRRSGAARPGS